jgi:CheY-like chemotaxis protein
MIIEKRALNKKTIYWTVLVSSLIAIIFIILGWFIAHRIAERITTPLQKLIRQADDIIAGNYHVLTDTAKHISNDATDEVAKFGSALQQISLNLEKSQQAVKEYTHNLEHKVEARTSELELARQQVVMANTLKGEFLVNMSHEIRTPLSAFMGLTHLLNQTSLTPRQQDYIRKLASSGENLLSIINDILDFAKIEAGMLQLEKIAFNFDDMLNEVIKSVAQPIQQKGLELIIDIKDSVPDTLIGDPARLRQVFLNLLNNAVKFTECGEIIISVEVPESGDQQIQLRCSVTDSGIGMTTEQSARLFKTFTHADSTINRRNGGTGLGLTISKKLVEMMNGQISASSTYGIGSEFTFSSTFGIPAQHQQSEPLTKILLPVLLIDNHSHSSNAIAGMLKRLGCEVTQINESQQGLDDLAHANKTGHPYQLVIIKADMPQIRGENVAERIKTNKELKSAPKILLLSRFSNTNEYASLVGSSIDALLASPVTEGHLKQTIKRMLSPVDQISLTMPSMEASFEGCHLLLAEDDEINQQVATELLRTRGIEVTIANNGREALDLLLGKNPVAIDGILMDIQMPEMDGYEATSRLRSDPRYKTLPIIGLTAHTSDEEKQLCLEKGMQAHLSKPIDPDHLFNSIERFISPSGKQTKSSEIATANLPEKIALTRFAGIDLKEGLQRVGDNSAIYARIAKQFINKNSDAADNISQQLLIKQFDSAQTLIHTLRGAAASIGATDLAYSALILEHAIKGKQAEATIARHLEEFDKAQKTSLASLSAIILHLKNTVPVSETKPPVMRPVLTQNERIKILLVDDNLTNLEVLKQQLSIIGYESEPCLNGAEAWGKWQASNYHLILTDINMPGMDGYELTRRIRDYEAGSSHIPIIAFTASSSKSDANRCIKIGMDEFLLKPMALEELKHTLEKWLPKELPPLANERTEQTASCKKKVIPANIADSPIDIVVLIQVVGDDANVHRVLFESFIKSAETAVSAINAAIENEAIEVVIKQTHKLKSASRNMGAVKLADLCEAMEGAARAGQQQKIVSLLPTLNRLFDYAQKFVTSYIKTTLSA